MRTARRLCLKLAVALTAATAFLLPLKFGGISGLAEVPGTFPSDLWEWLIFSSYPTEIFTILCGVLLALTLLGGATRLPQTREMRWMSWLWGALLPLAVLPGFVNTAVRDYAYLQLAHFLGVGAWCWATALLIADDPRRKKLFVGALLAGFLLAVLAGWRLYFWGFAETRRYFAEKAASGAVQIDKQLQIKLDDNRVYATFTSCNSFAGFIILVGALFAVCAWKFGERFEPRKVSKWLFMGAAALLTFGVLPLTHSRGALLCALLAALGAFLCLRLPRAVKLAGLILFIAAGIGGAWYEHHKGRGFLSVAERVDYLRTSSRLTAAHPFAGAGWDGFFREHMRIKFTKTDESAHDPHNFVASFASQSGVLPGLLALAALALPLWALFRRYRDFDLPRRAVCWGCAAAALHMLMEMDCQVPAQPAAFWLLAWSALTDAEAPPEPVSRRYATVSAAALAALSAFAVGIFVLRGDLAFARFGALVTPEPGEMWRPPSEDAVNSALAEVRHSRQHLPFALEQLADYRYNVQRDPVAAEKLLRESLALGGDRPGVYDRLGEVAFARGDFAAAGRHWRRAHKLFPRKYPPAVAALSRRWIAVFGGCWNGACGKLFPAKYPEAMPPSSPAR